MKIRTHASLKVGILISHFTPTSGHFWALIGFLFEPAVIVEIRLDLQMNSNKSFKREVIMVLMRMKRISWFVRNAAFLLTTASNYGGEQVIIGYVEGSKSDA